MKVYVFGRGMYYKIKKNSINSKYAVDAFIDNAVCKDDKIFEGGMPVYHPSFLLGKKNVVIIIATTDFVNVFYQLKELQIDDKQIIFLHNVNPCFDNFEELICEGRIRIDIRENCLFFIDGKSKTRLMCKDDFQKCMYTVVNSESGKIDIFNSLPIKPFSKHFGYERGIPVDRYYIEKFIAENRQCIRGDVLEVANNKYSLKYGNPDCSYHIMHVWGWGGTERINLETGEGIIENSIDCFICTQVLQMIYDIEHAVKNIYRMLKPGGNAIITISGISQISMNDYANWGEYWRVTKKACACLFEKYFKKDSITIKSYGNVKATCGFLYGICCDEMNQKDLEYIDEQYPLLLAINVKK